MTASGKHALTQRLAAGFFLISVIFVWRSFYGMRIHSGRSAGEAH